MKVSRTLLTIPLWIALAVLTTLFGGLAQAAPSDSISFKGYLTNTEGVAVASSTKDINVDIYNNESDGNLLFSELHSDTTILNGRFELTLGAVSSSWSSINFTQPLWLEITVDSETLSPRIPFASVPSARTTLQIGTLTANKWCNSDGIQVQCIQEQPIGSTGPQGSKGAVGVQGSPGLLGSTGLQGRQGDAGSEGLKGLPGDEGTVGSGFPLLTSTQRSATLNPMPGFGLYNTTDQRIEYWNGSEWRAVGIIGASCPVESPIQCDVSGIETCVAVGIACDCPVGYSKCSDNKCVPNAEVGDLCPYYSTHIDRVNCPVEYPEYCTTTGGCRATTDACPSQPICPVGYDLCPDLQCASQATGGCDETMYNKCSGLGFKCPNGECARRPENCATQLTCLDPTAYWCAGNNTCVASSVDCGAITWGDENPLIFLNLPVLR